MVHGDGRDDRKQGRHRVGGVEPPAHTDLQDREIRGFLREMGEGRGREGLEVGRRVRRSPGGDQRLRPLPDDREGAGERPGGDEPIADADALLDAHEMRGGVQAGPETVLRQDPGEHGGNRSLPVRAGNEDGREMTVGTPQGPEESPDVSEPELDPEPLEGFQIIEALPMGH